MPDEKAQMMAAGPALVAGPIADPGSVGRPAATLPSIAGYGEAPFRPMH
jgi:hypothetical protein